MTDLTLKQILADGISNVALVNGVFRITLIQTPDGKTANPVAELLVPANQFSTFINGLGKAGEDIAVQIKEQTGEKTKN